MTFLSRGEDGPSFLGGMHKKLHKMCIVIEVVTIIELIKLAPHLTVDTWNYISLE
jgi:hypothetical protein